jgi:hypothetical protein
LPLTQILFCHSLDHPLVGNDWHINKGLIMKKSKVAMVLLAGLVFLIIISACATKGDAPAKAVEMYYEALVNKDETRMLSLACAEWETTALLEYDSFSNVTAELVNFACQSAPADDERAQVQCTGAISASYGEEVREFSLSDRVYRVVQERGEWRLCGYE